MPNQASVGKNSRPSCMMLPPCTSDTPMIFGAHGCDMIKGCKRIASIVASSFTHPMVDRVDFWGHLRNMVAPTSGMACH